jgi:hypothetical protein
MKQQEPYLSCHNKEFIENCFEYKNFSELFGGAKIFMKRF